ncbi:MAG: hemerythrin domain-containing protein [Rhizobiaceae bacterium]
MSGSDDPERLETRQGLPDDLSWLYRRYPRDLWQHHENLGGMAGFWLKRHDMFREIGPMLRRGIDGYRENPDDPASLAAWLAPRINFFLGELNGHHQIEDHHYFPVFKHVEPTLTRGFDLLDSDHHVIHEALERNAETANAFFRSLAEGSDSARFAADSYAGENEKLIALLLRHLEDEEDLIVPMILDRGENALGLA